ncbi:MULTISPECIES: DUF1656 domain-containing protein [Pseudomonas]|uniref:DUF1656 domain-containing protein n=1 Tax=Pseudomonas fluorescens TaxID=294 RepID=A0A5E6V4A1_PSEFL|nr:MULTISPECIES: DUF1656 domain-containing protein [Pseudomonas]VVN10064.1 hypothetical protein PS652_03762 [Pseudomonas fluorescens]
MLSEFSIANVYFPPLFIYLLVATVLYLILERMTRRWLDLMWHPNLLRFFLSVSLLSLLVIKL